MSSPRRLGLLVAIVGLCFGVVCSPALASESGWWAVSSTSSPTYVPPGGQATIEAFATNRGDTAIATENTPVTITDTLPEGFTVENVETLTGMDEPFGETKDGEPVCKAEPGVVSCTVSDPRTIQPYEEFDMEITVKAGSRSGTNTVSVSGGESRGCVPAGKTGRWENVFCSTKHEGLAQGAWGENPGHAGPYEGVGLGAVTSATARRNVIVSSEPTPFGITEYEMALENEGGSADREAGSHPFQFTTAFALNESESSFSGLSGSRFATPALPKDFRFHLPPGLIGDATTVPQCKEHDFSHVFITNNNACPADTAVGVANVLLEVQIGNLGNKITVTNYSVPVVNLVPAVGEPARFGFEVEQAPVIIDTAVNTGRDYGIVASSLNTTEDVHVLSTSVTLWGVPGDPHHDTSRGYECLSAAAFVYGNGGQCTPENQANPKPFLTLPTSCTGELATSMEADAWNGAVSAPSLYQAPVPGLTGCSKLPFHASISVAPDVQEASKPSGLKVDVHIPQEVSHAAEGLVGSDVKSMKVTLPEGVTIDPAGADGLEACSEPQVGYEPAVSEPPGKLDFSASLPEPLNPGLFLGAKGFCPNGAKIGTVKITIPVIAHPLEGSVYLAAQNANPFGSLVAMYIVAEDPVSGVLVKLAGEVKLNEATGQIVATFENTPQAPFEDAELHFFGGDRAPLSTPALCGTYTTTAQVYPWSGTPPVETSSSFQITSGPGGGPCPNPPGDGSRSTLPFQPELTAGTTSNQAGGFSPFTMTMSRQDGQQDLKSVSLHMPPGLSAILTGVPLCGEAQADAGTCPASSLIGETTVGVGLGSNPYTVKGGKVYLTEKYGNAPYGLSIVNPAVAGPFNLGNVIVRAKLEVDPITAAVTVTSDSSGPYAIPPSLDGIPLEIKHINVTVNRPGFTFNPTGCGSLAVTGTLQSIEGSAKSLSVPFQATNCATLAFKPSLTVSTNGKTSRANGASLHVKLAYPNAPFGSQANIKSVKVDLPKQLPSELKTLQKACPIQTFTANPAACDPESRIGTAKAVTPLLPVPLEGPAYFVSNAGLAFPELVIVLSGYGTTVQLHAETFIDNKTNVTSSTFRSIPDVPVGTFELTFPEGKYSALAAPANKLCTAGALKMPTAFTAQNGDTIKQSTPISVTGCVPSVSVLRHSARGSVASITASVPSAGTLTASGPGLSHASAHLGGAGTVTLELALSRGERKFLGRHPGRSLRARVKLLFSPTHGRRLSTGVTVLLR